MEPTRGSVGMQEEGVARITGRWRNQFGSQVELVTGPDGALGGTFVSGVGAVSREHVLVGYYASSAEGPCALGFVVRWPEEHSVTAWSGRYDADADAIEATWLLSSTAERDSWRSTTVGHDVFHRA